jgi:hypothetical protein
LEVALKPLKTKVLEDSIKNIQAGTQEKPKSVNQPSIKPQTQQNQIEQPQIIQTIKDKLESVKNDAKQANSIIQFDALENKIKEHISSSQKLLTEISDMKELLRVGALLNSGIDATTLIIDSEYSEDIREKSEHYLYSLLCDKYGTANVFWLNQNSESGSNHDFEVKDETQKIILLIECKGTAKDKPTFYLTANEWNYFLKHKSMYQVYRVFNVDNNMNAVCIDNLYAALLNEQVVPYLLKPEILKEARVFLSLLN